jgi:hypothetical protein
MTFGVFSCIFCALTWSAALFGEFYAYFGNRSVPYVALLGAICHILALLAYVFKSGRKQASWSLVTFWIIGITTFAYACIDAGRSMRRLD